MKYLVVIPYITCEKQGRELEFCIAGWQRHFKEDFDIVIVGDNPFEGNNTIKNITYIACPRVPACSVDNYRAHLDFVNKFKTVYETYKPLPEGFIYSCDDFYAVNDFTFADIEILKYVPGDVDFDPQSPNPFRRDKMKTKKVLQSIGFPCRNFTTHLPQYFEWDKLIYLWNRFDMYHNSLVFEDLYFNYYYPVAPATALDGDDRYKCSVLGAYPNPDRIRRAFEEKIWINNNIDGYCHVLEKLLSEYYGL